MNAEPRLALCDGRKVEIRRVEIAHSLEGFLEGDPARMWDMVLKGASRVMGCGRDRIPPAYVVIPMSVSPGRDWSPKWQVCVRLQSTPVFDNTEYASEMVLVFFCSDIDSATVPELVSGELSSISEEVWKAHSWDWSY